MTPGLVFVFPEIFERADDLRRWTPRRRAGKVGVGCSDPGMPEKYLFNSRAKQFDPVNRLISEPELQTHPIEFVIFFRFRYGTARQPLPRPEVCQSRNAMRRSAKHRSQRSVSQITPA